MRFFPGIYLIYHLYLKLFLIAIKYKNYKRMINNYIIILILYTLILKLLLFNILYLIFNSFEIVIESYI